MWDRLDVGAWVGIIALILAIPVGVMSHVLGHRFLVQLDKRKLVRGDATRQQAIRVYNRIKSSTTTQATDIPITCCSQVRL
jgi:hypothetical protein